MPQKKVDFIIKTQGGKNVLRRYKGSDAVVTVPDCVEKIGDFVFADDIESNETIKKIIVPDSVKEISCDAFSYCEALEEIRFPNGMEKFDINFGHCPSVAQVTIPDSVTQVANLCSSKALKKIKVGPNIVAVHFSVFKKGKMLAMTPKTVADILCANPAYELLDGFVVNKIHKTLLFRLNFDKSKVHVPKGIETIAPNAFYDFYRRTALAKDMAPLEKVVIPASVKKISRVAFMGCENLKDVVYGGMSKNLQVDSWAFFMCPCFHNDGREITCKDKPKAKPKKLTNLKLERIGIIHRKIKAGGFPTLEELRRACSDDLRMNFGSATINRDIEFLRTRFYAPLEYDYYEKGYYYDQEFSLSLD
ncbi:MAG: leucine-rich repeat domain-containing protein [Treponema sp.]|nr:leucine-rich repeat domain-containing protein [Treponema sp.]